jgi:hypothetical protein
MWSVMDDIDTIYAESVAEAEKVTEYYKLKELVIDEDHKIPLLNEKKIEKVKQLFKKAAEVNYVDAKRNIIASKEKIPRWAIIMIVLLGWNEFVWVFNSPWLILLLIFAGSCKFYDFSIDDSLLFDVFDWNDVSYGGCIADCGQGSGESGCIEIKSEWG